MFFWHCSKQNIVSIILRICVPPHLHSILISKSLTSELYSIGFASLKKNLFNVVSSIFDFILWSSAFYFLMLHFVFILVLLAPAWPAGWRAPPLLAINTESTHFIWGWIYQIIINLWIVFAQICRLLCNENWFLLIWKN